MDEFDPSRITMVSFNNQRQQLVILLPIEVRQNNPGTYLLSQMIKKKLQFTVKTIVYFGKPKLIYNLS